MNIKKTGFILSCIIIPNAFCQSTLSLIGFEGIGIPPDLTRSIAQQIESKLPGYCNCSVISQEELDGTMIDFLKKRTSRNSSSVKSTSPSPSLSVEQVVTGTLSKIGPTYNIILKLVSVRTGIIIRSISREHSGSIEALFPFTDAAVAELFKGSEPIKIIDTLYIPAPAPVAVVKPQQRKEVFSEPPSNDEKSQWMIEKIGIGAIAIFATLAAIILSNTTR
jgi:hypothetical protein